MLHFAIISFVFVSCVDTNLDTPTFQKLTSCITNKRLEGYVIKTFDVKSRAQCMLLCLQHEDCTSVNVGSVSNDVMVCEINKQFVKFNCAQLSDVPNYDFYEQVDKTLYPSTCKELINKDPSLPSGVYYIKPNATIDAFEVYFEMETAGGGWALVYSYRFVDLNLGIGPARLSIWPTWDKEGETPKSSVVPLSDLDEGAMDFDLWKQIGEEFLTTSTVTNWYACAPAATNGGSLTGWRDGDLDCSVAKVEVHNTGCDDVVPALVHVNANNDPHLHSPGSGQNIICWSGQSEYGYPVHDPCGRGGALDLETNSTDPRGAIYVR